MASVSISKALHREAVRLSIMDDIASVISAVGTPGFSSELLSFLHRATGAEHYTAFQLGYAAPRRILSLSLDGSDTAIRQSALYTSGGFWREDPVINEARSCLSSRETTLLCMDIEKLPSGAFRDVLYGRANIRERLMICGGPPDQKFGLSILRCAGKGCLTSGELRRISRVASIILSLIAKHNRITYQVGGAATTLTSLAEIERSIASAFPRREAEVCARILYGISGAGIALDLGISEQTVMTYRKRAYDRLGIGSQRELLLWYLSLWQPCEPAADTRCSFGPKPPTGLLDSEFPGPP